MAKRKEIDSERVKKEALLVCAYIDEIKKISQSEFADQVNSDRFTVNKWRNGTREIHINSLRDFLLHHSGLYYEIMNLRNVPQLIYDLGPYPWLNSRYDSRESLHPEFYDKYKTNLFENELCAIPTYENITKFLTKGKPSHIFIQGQIATGKSSLTELLIRFWQVEYPNRKIIVLPLAGSYNYGDHWQRVNAVKQFFRQISALANRSRQKCLIVIEDWHENFAGKRDNFGFLEQPSINLRDYDVIVTSRPGSSIEEKEDFFQKRFEKWSGLVCNRYELDSSITAQILVKSSFDEQLTDTQKLQWQHLFRRLGNSLVGLAAALYEFQKGETKDINMNLAFRAVNGEIENIFNPDGSNFKFGEISSSKKTLLTIWMLGGLEVEVSKSQLQELLDSRDLSAEIKGLERLKEIYLREDGGIICSRHPAWGQLTMKSVDEFNLFGSLKKQLIEDLLCGADASSLSEADQLVLNNSVITALIYGVLHHKLAQPGRLGFLCTGKHMHDEYAQAARRFLNNASFDKTQLEEKAKLLIGIASCTRRFNCNDFQQMQKLLSEGEAAVLEAFKIENSLRIQGEFEQIEDPKGATLYQIAYFQSMRGDLQGALKSFNESAEFDLQNERFQGAAMSAIRAGIMLTYLKEFDEAKIHYGNAETWLDNYKQIPDHEELIFLRFTGNLWHARFELALSNRKIKDAREYLDKFEYFSLQANIGMDRNIYEARISLATLDFDKALVSAEKGIFDADETKTVERYWMCRRTIGDAYYGLNKIDQALNSYREILPELGESTESLYIDLKHARSRAVAISKGISGAEYFKSAVV